VKPRAVDLFAGPGGWDYACAALGFAPLGIEFDDAACATRAEVGLCTEQADVAALDPADYGPIDLLIASPPCQAFSNAGRREGIADLPLVWEAAKAIDEGGTATDLSWRDPRAALVLEPLRWALALEPDLLAWEQVPPVLDFWRFCGGVLERRGYSTWAGICEAERYGVPQTRERAVLLASKRGIAEPPRPTHQRYVKGESARHEATFEGEVLPWVSMAEALGWGMTNRPASTVMTPHGGAAESGVLDGGSHQRQVLRDARAAGDWTHQRPSPTITSGTARCEGGVLVYPTWRNGNQPNASERRADEPAPTIAFGHNAAGVEWVFERPATTVCADPRLSPPGYRGRAEDYDDEGNYTGERSMDNAVKVTLEEAAILQSFPPDYPFQGTKAKRFEQVGNAVPPLVARAILTSLLEVPA